MELMDINARNHEPMANMEGNGRGPGLFLRRWSKSKRSTTLGRKVPPDLIARNRALSVNAASVIPRINTVFVRTLTQRHTRANLNTTTIHAFLDRHQIRDRFHPVADHINALRRDLNSQQRRKRRHLCSLAFRDKAPKIDYRLLHRQVVLHYQALTCASSVVLARPRHPRNKWVPRSCATRAAGLPSQEPARIGSMIK